MIAKLLIISNIDEIDKVNEENEKYGLNKEIPKSKLITTDFLFNLKDIKFAYLNSDNEIVINIHGEMLNLEFNNDIWNELVNNFKK